ncbi:protein xylosyltransferase [Pseudoscourfieldia marina]
MAKDAARRSRANRDNAAAAGVVPRPTTASRAAPRATWPWLIAAAICGVIVAMCLERLLPSEAVAKPFQEGLSVNETSRRQTTRRNRQSVKAREGDDVVVAAIVKDEVEYIAEWLSFLHCAGVKHVHILDDGSTDGTQEVVAKYRELGFASLYTADDLPESPNMACRSIDHNEVNRAWLWSHRHQPSTPMHKPTMHLPTTDEDALKRVLYNGTLFTAALGSEYTCPQSRQNRWYQHVVDSLVGTPVKWVGLVDVDEFPYPVRKGQTLADALAEFEHERIAAIGLKWQLFGSSYHEMKPNAPVIEAYTMRAPALDDLWEYAKSFVRPVKDLTINIHIPIVPIATSDYAVLVVGENNPVLRMNHYRSKSTEDWEEKTSKGCPHSLAVEFCDKDRPNWRTLYDRNDIDGGVPLNLRMCMRRHMLEVQPNSAPVRKLLQDSEVPQSGALRTMWSGEWDDSTMQFPAGTTKMIEETMSRGAKGLLRSMLPRAVTRDCQDRIKDAARRIADGSLLVDIPRHPHAVIHCPVDALGNDETEHVNNEFDPVPEKKRCDTPDKVGTSCSEKAAKVLFAIHASPVDDKDIVLRLLRRIYDPNHYYVVAIDAAPTSHEGEEIARLAQEFFDEMSRGTGAVLGTVIRDVDVVYGGFSLMEAYMDAWRAGLQLEKGARRFKHESWDFVINLSAADWPIHNVDFISASLAKHGIANHVESFTQIRDYIEGRALGDWFVECPGEPCALDGHEEDGDYNRGSPGAREEHRKKRAKVDDSTCSGYSYWLNDEAYRNSKPLMRNSYMFGGSAFYVLHRDFVHYTLSCLDNSTFVEEEPYCKSVHAYRDYFQLGMSGEELFVQTVLLNGPYCTRLAATRRWVNWGDRVVRRRRRGDYPIGSPGMIPPHLARNHIIRTRHAYFARKLDSSDQSDEVRAILDEHAQGADAV